MGLRSKITVNNSAVENTLTFLENFQAILNEEAQLTHDELEPSVLQNLEVTPGAVKYPIEWTSEKQRKAFFASDGFGHGIPYQRTGKLALAWDFVIEDNSAVIRNKAPASIFVYGSLARTNPGASQQRFHLNTGWQTGYNTADFWLREFARRLIRNMNTRLGEAVGKVTGKTQ